MKRVLDGMTYDTGNALVVCEVFEGYRTDLTHIDAVLYRTKRSKQFFLAGYGGAMTRFSQRCTDGSYAGGEKIVPLTIQEAKHFADKHAKPEVIAEYFEAAK